MLIENSGFGQLMHKAQQNSHNHDHNSNDCITNTCYRAVGCFIFRRHP